MAGADRSRQIHAHTLCTSCSDPCYGVVRLRVPCLYTSSGDRVDFMASVNAIVDCPVMDEPDWALNYVKLKKTRHF